MLIYGQCTGLMLGKGGGKWGECLGPCNQKSQQRPKFILVTINWKNIIFRHVQRLNEKK